MKKPQRSLNNLRILIARLPDSLPETHLYSAFAHQGMWDYEVAIPVLQRYLKFELTAYEHAVAKINLLSCFIGAKRISEAVELKQSLAQEFKVNSWELHRRYNAFEHRHFRISGIEHCFY